VPITVTFTPTPTGTPVTTPVLVFTPHVNVSVPGFVGGGRIGVNYQTGPFVFGFEGDFAGMTLKGHATGIFSGTTPSVKIATSSGTTPTTVSATVTYAGTSVYQTTADWATTFTGRVGYTFDRVLAYGKVGMAVEQDGDTEVSTTTSCSTNPGTSTTPAGTISCRAAISRAGTATRYGWTAGTGIEYAFDNHWSGFVEYDHLGFLSHLLNFFTGPGTAATSRLVSLNIDRVIAGANYRF
jgi:outer membrane immunogenic protein